jgi:Ser/Thr protein kinase RdoA (MazF antagonist)
MTQPQYSQTARAALREYDLAEFRLMRIGNGENVTYQVQVSQATSEQVVSPESADIATFDPQKYLLRIHRPQGYVRAKMWNQVTTIQTELEWLKQIAGRTPSHVPLPVKSRAGLEVVTVPCNGVDYNCTLMRWVRGRYTTVTPSRATAYSVGVALAWAHQASEQWLGQEATEAVSNRRGFENFDFELHEAFTTLHALRLGRDIVRPLYDQAMLCGWERLMLARAKNQSMPGDLVDRIAAALDRADSHISGLPVSPRTFGLVHADPTPTNFVVYRKSLGLIDFSSCGFGWYLYDLAAAISQIMGDPHKSLLAGYQTIRPLSKADIGDLREFLRIARINIILEYWPDECIYTPLDRIDEMIPVEA